jgi:predicted phosphoribosyltransferase
MTMFRNRREAGRLLARRLATYSGRPDVIVFALPRGGVPVAYEVAKALDAPLEVFVVRKLGMPGHEEFAIGAVASGGLVVRRPLLIEAYQIPDEIVGRIETRERAELERRERLYRPEGEPLEVRGKTVLLVDDGLATGSTMHAAVLALRKARPARIVVAVPVASPEASEGLRVEADEAVCLATPEPFGAVGQFYDDFRQTTDDEVLELLALARGRRPMVEQLAFSGAGPKEL